MCGIAWVVSDASDDDQCNIECSVHKKVLLCF